MIDYGEDKQTYGTPKIAVGPVSQILTALYIGVFLLAFFLPEFSTNFLAQINADLPKKFWTLLTGIFVFPESAGVYTQVPAGFWVILTFFLIFLVVRPIEEKAASLFSFIAFLLLLMVGSALAIWGIAPKQADPAGTWSFWFSGAAGFALWKFRTLNMKFGERRFPAKYFYLALTIIPIITSGIKLNWSRAVLYVVFALLGVAWSCAEERITNKKLSANESESLK